MWKSAGSGSCRIIADIWPVLKPGGILIYSTCTYNTKEDEENVRWICEEFGAEPLPLTVNDEWQLTGDLQAERSVSSAVAEEGLQAAEGSSLPVFHFLPHKTAGEGSSWLRCASRWQMKRPLKPLAGLPKAKYPRKRTKKGERCLHW